VWFAGSAFRATLDVSPARARRLFLVSITYLPALFALLAVNKLG
jgi:heme O synthase-like polyprenyltransferase